MRLAALFLLAAAAGFAVGRLTAPEVGGRGGERAVSQRSAAPRLPDAPPPSAGSEPREQSQASGIAESNPASDIVQPSDPCEESGDDGLLLVDLGALPRAWVGSVDIVGAYDTDEIESQDGDAARFQGAPGTYDVWWLDREGRRVGTLVRLDAAKVTRLRAADHRTDAPIPRGLGALSLFVEAAEGGGLSAKVEIFDGHYSMDMWTGEDGYASSVIRPGRYTLRVGAHASNAVVEESRTTAHRIAHDREGDLVLVADRQLKISVCRSGARESSWEGWVVAVPEGIPYLAEGEYGLFIPYAFGAPFGHVTIHAGRTTRFHCKPPTGGVVVHAVPAGAAIYIGPWRDGDEQAMQEAIRLVGGGADPVPLMPGRYVVTATAEGREPASTQVDVSDRVVEVSIELAPLR